MDSRNSEPNEAVGLVQKVQNLVLQQQAFTQTQTLSGAQATWEAGCAQGLSIQFCSLAWVL